MGLLMPLAHVNGSSGRRKTAPMLSSAFAISLSMLYEFFDTTFVGGDGVGRCGYRTSDHDEIGAE